MFGLGGFKRRLEDLEKWSKNQPQYVTVTDLTDVAVKVGEKIPTLITKGTDWLDTFVGALAGVLADGLDWSDLEQAVADKLVDRVQVTLIPKRIKKSQTVSKLLEAVFF